MDALGEFLEIVRRAGVARGHFLGLLHLLIGRQVQRKDGLVISEGVTWRALARLLKTVRWDPDMARELDLDPATLPPRDRERFWYSVILQAGVNTKKASDAADDLAKVLKNHGYSAGPAPRP